MDIHTVLVDSSILERIFAHAYGPPMKSKTMACANADYFIARKASKVTIQSSMIDNIIVLEFLQKLVISIVFLLLPFLV